MLHDEGADFLLRRMFPVGGSYATARSDWRLGISGWGCLDVPDTPNGGLVAGGFGKSKGWADVLDPYANPHGVFGADHATILGMGLRAVTPAVVNDGRTVALATSEAEFEHGLEWTPYGVVDAPDWRGPQWEPEHGYPWKIPNVRGDYWDSVDPDWSAMLAENLATGATFPVGHAFLGSPSGELLLASMRLATCVIIRPGGSLIVRYRGRLWPHPLSSGAIVTTAFLELVLRRGLVNDVDDGDVWRAVLLADAAESITPASTWASVTPITGTGYAAVALASWAKDGADAVTAACGGWTNASGTAWGVANYVGIVANFGEDTVLCWAEPLASPLGLPAGDAFDFPSGVRLELADGA